MKNVKIVWFLLLGLSFNTQAQQFIRDFQGYYGYSTDDGKNNAITTTASGGYFMAIEHEGNLGVVLQLNWNQNLNFLSDTLALRTVFFP